MPLTRSVWSSHLLNDTFGRLLEFLKVADEFGYWNGSPVENAAVGINLPMPTT